MLVLYIVACVLAILLLALMIPIRVKFQYSNLCPEGEMLLRISYLFFGLSFPKDHSPEEVETEKKTESTGDKLTSFIHGKSLREILSMVAEITRIASEAFIGILRHIRVQELDVFVIAGGEDAASVAMLYGEACAVIYPAAGVVKEFCATKKLGVTVDADYDRKESVIQCECYFSVLPIWVLLSGLRLIKKLLPYIKKLKTER